MSARHVAEATETLEARRRSRVGRRTTRGRCAGRRREKKKKTQGVLGGISFSSSAAIDLPTSSPLPPLPAEKASAAMPPKEKRTPSSASHSGRGPLRFPALLLFYFFFCSSSACFCFFCFTAWSCCCFLMETGGSPRFSGTGTGGGGARAVER